MAYTVEFEGTGKVTMTVEKSSRAKIVNDALKSAGITATVTVNKVIDFNAAKKPLTKKQQAAIDKRKKERAAEKTGAEKAAKTAAEKAGKK